MPSLSEGRPNVVLEALACEVPVVATDVGGVPELMVDGETGYLVPAKNPGELSRKINKLLENKSQRENMKAPITVSITIRSVGPKRRDPP